VHLGLQVILLNYTNVIVIAVFELHTLLIVLQMCETLFRQIISTFRLLLHLKGRLSRLTCRRFFITLLGLVFTAREMLALQALY